MSDSEKISKALKIRKKTSQHRPEFARQENYRFPRLGDKWRSCTGIRSKMRLKKKGRAAIVETGYRGPKLARGLHPTGKREVLVYTPEDLDGLNPSTEVVRIASTVGKRKRLEIIKRAESLMIKVVNKRPSDAVPVEAEVEEAKEPEETKEKALEETKAEIKEEKEEEWSVEREEREVEGSG
ncbi:MAG: 50S ribosomal protein L32e [Candidatus Methanomethylicaceae archaeon]